MKAEFESLSTKLRAEGKLETEEIHWLMTYALELLKEFGRLTEISINVV